MNDTVSRSSHSRLDYISIFNNMFATFSVCVGLGMTAVLFPVSLENSNVPSSYIGIIMALETVASFLICFLLPNILKHMGMSIGMVFTLFFRVLPLSLILFSDNIIVWGAVVFFYAIGCYAFLLLTQVWVNSIKFGSKLAVWMAIYSTAMSIGLASGPVLLNLIDSFPRFFRELMQPIWYPIASLHGEAEIDTNKLKFLIAMLINLLATFPILVSLKKIPKFSFSQSPKLFETIFKCKGPMFAISLAGVSMFGVSAFITVYGLRNSLTLTDAALLLTFFNLGAIFLEIPVGYLSNKIDKRYLIVSCAFLCMVCAVYLPIVIYVNYQAWLLVFIWGGVIGSIYSLALTIIGERFSGEELISANAGYSVMEGIGGTIGIIAIGFSMDLLGYDGFPYTIMLASVLYFSFALTRYRVV